MSQHPLQKPTQKSKLQARTSQRDNVLLHQCKIKRGGFIHSALPFSPWFYQDGIHNCICEWFLWFWDRAYSLIMHCVILLWCISQDMEHIKHWVLYKYATACIKRLQYFWRGIVTPWATLAYQLRRTIAVVDQEEGQEEGRCQEE